MGKSYALIIWDLDGTLLDTAAGILAASKYTIERFGFRQPSPGVLTHFIGPPIQHSFAKTFHLTDDQAEEMADVFRKRYKEKDLFKAKLYPQIKDLIKQLYKQGIKQAVATYKREDYAREIVEYFGLMPYLNITCGADFDGKLSKTDIIVNAIKMTLGVKSADEKIVMIGDTENDAVGARNLGIDFIAVTYGFGYKPEPIGTGKESMKFADSVEELGDLLGVQYED